MTDGIQLWDRRWYLSVGTLDVSDLDIDFKVERDTSRAPNTAEIRVWNLKPESRAAIAPNARVILRAGYVEDGDPPPLLYSGDARRVWVEPEGPDVVLVVESRDGGRAYNQARFSRTYNPGTPVASVLEDLVDALGVGRGNAAEFTPAYALRNGADVFADGFVADGPVRLVLNALLRGAGLRWSIQNGSLQVQRAGIALQSRAVVLAADTGLIDVPSRDERGLVTVTTLIQPGLEPGRRVVLESSAVEGTYEIRKATYHGETLGNDWYATLELRAIRS